MVLITGAYKPTYNCGASHCRWFWMIFPHSELHDIVQKKKTRRSVSIAAGQGPEDRSHAAASPCDPTSKWMDGLYIIYTMWGPPVMWMLVNKSPSNYSYLHTINHSYWSYVNQLSYPTGASHCIYIYMCVWLYIYIKGPFSMAMLNNQRV